jgi:hypothetical protein
MTADPLERSNSRSFSEYASEGKLLFCFFRFLLNLRFRLDFYWVIKRLLYLSLFIELLL